MSALSGLRDVVATDAPLPPGALDLLNALKDIHEPPPPGLWPPAPGLWLVAVILVAAVAAGVLAWQRRRVRSAPIRVALRELDAWASTAAARPAVEAADELAALLRRAALVRYPRAEVAALSGDAWLAFLDHTSGSSAFTQGPARILGDDRYAPAVELDAESLDALARRWLQAHFTGPVTQAG